MELVGKGAEANLYRKNGTLVKERIPKGYRHPSLDEWIRKTRTRSEARIIERTGESGVRVPRIIGTSDFSIEMEWIDGTPLRDCLSRENLEWAARRVGESIALLHNSGIIHHDLTTSNMIVREQNGERELVFIDFGLSFHSTKPEDMATDLHLLEEAVESTHYELAEEFMNLALGEYERVMGKNAKPVMDRLEAIRKRGRYMKRRE